MMIAFLDTMILVWWIRRLAVSGQDDMIQRADWLMRYLEDEKATVVVSTVSIAEFLRGSDHDDLGKQNAIIEQTFICRPFDQHAAHVAASIQPKALTIADYAERSKTVLKADTQIVATAIAGRASVLYSHDKGMRNLADACGLLAKDLPDVPPSIFDVPRESSERSAE